MKAQDIILQLISKLPFITNQVTSNFSVVSIVPSGSDALVTTAVPHGLTVGRSAIISGADAPIAITNLTRAGTIGTADFTDDHDYTFGAATPNIIIADAVEANFNGTFTILSVPNRNRVTFSMDDSGATVATGAPLALNAGNVFQGYNGVFNVVSVPTTTTFTYTPIEPKTLAATGTTVLSTNARISGAVNFERALASYTAQSSNDVWLFVSLDDVVASRNRNIRSDAVDNLLRGQQGENFRQQTIQTFSIYAFIPASSSIGGRESRDLAEALFVPICQSVLFEEFDSLYFEGKQNAVNFVNHGAEAYNASIYIHRYTFEMVADLSFSDTVGYSDDVAFRDISITMGLTTGSETFTTDINLDEQP